MGIAQVVLGPGGHGTIAVRVGNQPPRGAVVGVGSDAKLTLGRLASPGLTIDLTVVSTSGQTQVIGTIVDGGVSLAATLLPRASAAVAAAAAGLYTLEIDKTPAGVANLVGLGSVRVSSHGGVRILGGLSEGTLLIQGGWLNSDGSFDFYASRRRAHVGVALQASFPTTATGSVTGSGQSVGLDGTQGLTVLGSRFHPATGFGSSLPGTLQTYSTLDPTAVVVVSGLSSPAGMLTVLQAGGAVPAELWLDLRTGFAVGNYVVTMAGQSFKRHLTGAVFQDRGVAVGFVVQHDHLIGEYQYTAGHTTSGNQGTITGGAVTVTEGSLQLSGPVSYGGTLTLSSTGNLTKLGAGTLLLTGNNSAFNGTTTIAGGVLNLTNTTANAVLNGTTGSIFGNLGNLTLASGGILNVGTGNLTVNGATLLTLTGGANTLVPVINGAVVTGPGGILTNPGGGLILSGGGTITLNNGGLTGSGTVLGPGGTILAPPGGLAGGTFVVNNGNLHFSNTFLTGLASSTGPGVTASLAEGVQVTVDGPLPAGVTVTLNGQPQDAGTFVAHGVDGSRATLSITRTASTP